MNFTSKDLMLASKMKVRVGDFSPSVWVAQPKWDGHRMVVISDGSGRIRFVKRGSDGFLPHYQNSNFPDRGSKWVLDGELLPGNDAYVVFDVLQWEGQDIRRSPLDNRLAILSGLAKPFASQASLPRVIVSPSGEPRVIEAMVNKLSMEGVVVKRRDSIYMAGRSHNWQKHVEVREILWTFYVHTDCDRLSVTDSNSLNLIHVAVDSETAENLRNSLPRRTVTTWERYQFPNYKAPTGHGVFHFWGWKNGRPRYPKFSRLAEKDHNSDNFYLEDPANVVASL